MAYLTNDQEKNCNLCFKSLILGPSKPNLSATSSSLLRVTCFIKEEVFSIAIK